MRDGDIYNERADGLDKDAGQRYLQCLRARVSRGGGRGARCREGGRGISRAGPECRSCGCESAYIRGTASRAVTDVGKMAGSRRHVEYLDGDPWFGGPLVLRTSRGNRDAVSLRGGGETVVFSAQRLGERRRGPRFLRGAESRRGLLVRKAEYLRRGQEPSTTILSVQDLGLCFQRNLSGMLSADRR
jgi:hypothetical protein